MAKTSRSMVSYGDCGLPDVRRILCLLVGLTMPLAALPDSTLADPPTAVDAKQGPAESGESAELRDKNHNAAKHYRSIGRTQIYAAADGSVWMFCNVDDHTHRSGYGEPPRITGFNKFMAIRATPQGKIVRWSSQRGELTANDFAARFFSRNGAIYGIMATGAAVRFAQSGDAAGTIVDVNPRDIGFSDLEDRWSGHLEEVKQLNKRESFVEVFEIQFGQRRPPARLFRKHKLQLAIRFENKNLPPDGLGWQRAIAYSLDKEKPWKEVLIDVASAE